MISQLDGLMTSCPKFNSHGRYVLNPSFRVYGALPTGPVPPGLWSTVAYDRDGLELRMAILGASDPIDLSDSDSAGD